MSRESWRTSRRSCRRSRTSFRISCAETVVASSPTAMPAAATVRPSQPECFFIGILLDLQVFLGRAPGCCDSPDGTRRGAAAFTRLTQARQFFLALGGVALYARGMWIGAALLALLVVAA